jgi:CRP/FNR family cyclic AMP-dependent transcriptional regulator
MTDLHSFKSNGTGPGPEPGRIRWPPADARPRRPVPSPVYSYVLDDEDDPSAESDLRMRATARLLATARVLDTGAGPCELEPWLRAAEEGPGLLILEGLLVHETKVGDRTAAELVGSGDLLQPPTVRVEEMVEHQSVWRALCPSRLALLDGAFEERARPWPQVGHALLRRASRRACDTDALRAIAAEPRLEVRLDLLLWHLAGRWGRVEPSGIRLTLPLTHRLIGQLIGAERPSVSHALHRLSRTGLVSGVTGDLHLHGGIRDHLDSLHERAGTAAGTLAGAAAQLS